MEHEWIMDLTKSFPRSPKATIACVTKAARAAEKGRPSAAGTLGESNYDCRMNRMHLGFIASDCVEFLGSTLSSRDNTGVPEQIKEKSPPRRTEKSTPTTSTCWATLQGRY